MQIEFESSRDISVHQDGVRCGNFKYTQIHDRHEFFFYLLFL